MIFLLMDEPAVKKPKPAKKKKFQYQWLDQHPEWRKWVQAIPSQEDKYYCLACKTPFSCGHCEMERHSSSEAHVKNMSVLRAESADPENITPTACVSEAAPDSGPEVFDFNERVQVAEIRFATFLAEHNIAMTIAPHLLSLVKQIGEEPAVLQAMKVGKTKATKLVDRVVSVVETDRITRILRENKFSIHVDETSDCTNDKWMSLMVRYVEPSTLAVRTELLTMLHLNATNCSAIELFKAFKNELFRKQIPFRSILGLACDNASVMVGKHMSFRTFLSENNPDLITQPCICHSLALVASAAFSAIPKEIERFVRGFAAFLNNSPKRTAVFRDFQDSFQDRPAKITRYAETRWLSRHSAVVKILANWPTLIAFLTDQSLEKSKQAEELLEIAKAPMTKAYLLFLEFALESFNKINAFFQSEESLMHRLQPSSKKMLVEILQRFLKPALLQPEIFDVHARNIDFGNSANQRAVTDIDIGDDCREYLADVQSRETPQAEVDTFRQNCLKFYVTASCQIRDRLPFDNEFLKNLSVFEKGPALLDVDRESTVERVLFVCRQLRVSDETKIRKEWHSLYGENTRQKEEWCKLSFDEMWMAICTVTNSDSVLRYETLRLLLGMVRTLPHSNAAAERAFSFIPDTKNKKKELPQYKYAKLNLRRKVGFKG